MDKYVDYLFKGNKDKLSNCFTIPDCLVSSRYTTKSLIVESCSLYEDYCGVIYF